MIRYLELAYLCACRQLCNPICINEDLERTIPFEHTRTSMTSNEVVLVIHVL